MLSIPKSKEVKIAYDFSHLVVTQDLTRDFTMQIGQASTEPTISITYAPWSTLNHTANSKLSFINQ